MSRSFLTIMLLLALLGSLQAQSGRVRDSSATPSADANKPAIERAAAEDAADTRTAQQVFEEANDYVSRKFAEFEKRKMPFDARLSEKIKQEQRDLAGVYATELRGRKLEGKDVYYLGMLHNLARNSDRALEAMRENSALGKMIRKVIEEPAPANVAVK